MTFYLASVDEAKGTVADDIRPKKRYYELGWEIISTHFDAKHGKKTREIDAERDTIVTCSGREFLYTAEFSRVISYQEFQDSPPPPAAEVVSLMDRFAGGRLPSDYFTGKHGPEARYRHYDEDREIITNLDVAGATCRPPAEPYCCFVIRKRAHGAYRNFDDDSALKILERLAESYESIFIVGRDLEQFFDLPKVRHVDLQTFAALIKDDKCHLIVGSLTGPMHIAALVSQARVCLVVNHDGYDLSRENHPVLMGRCITYSPSAMLFVHPLQVGELLERFRL